MPSVRHDRHHIKRTERYQMHFAQITSKTVSVAMWGLGQISFQDKVNIAVGNKCLMLGRLWTSDEYDNRCFIGIEWGQIPYNRTYRRCILPWQTLTCCCPHPATPCVRLNAQLGFCCAHSLCFMSVSSGTWLSPVRPSGLCHCPRWNIVTEVNPSTLARIHVSRFDYNVFWISVLVDQKPSDVC